MGSSINDSAVTGDIEAQQHHSNWLAMHKHLLRENKKNEDDRLGYYILKVVDFHRQPPQVFNPKEWRFGLHNRENMDTTGSEGVKLSIAAALGLVGQKWDEFCDIIVDDWKSMLICYGLEEGVTSWKEEEIKHVLALDALFLALWYEICTLSDPKDRQLWTSKVVLNPPSNVFFSRLHSWCNIIQHDIRRIENQVPFVLIQRVVEYIRKSTASQSEDNDELGVANYLEKWMGYAVKEGSNCFMDISGEAFKNENLSALTTHRHILGVVYGAICGQEGLKMKSVGEIEYIHIPSATKLKDSGIKIIGVAGPLYTMSYRNKCLFLPKMRMFDSTVSFIRNMAWYEATSITHGCMLHNYIFLLVDLIHMHADLEILIDCGVIHNECGNRAFEKWSTLEQDLLVVPSSKQHHDMQAAIKSRCKYRRYRLWREFITLFCSKPWLVMSTFVVVLVTGATLIQTYTAVIGSNRMKPQFPH